MQTQQNTVADLPDIVVGQRDYDELVAFADALGGPLANAAEALLNELDRATLVPQDEVPADRARMNSVVTFETVDGFTRIFQLVYPDKADVDKQRVSILTPIGRALIGLGVGQSIPWAGRDGHTHILTVKTVTQGT